MPALPFRALLLPLALLCVAAARGEGPQATPADAGVEASALRGEWRGAARFGFTVRGRRTPDPKAGGTLVLQLRPDRSVGGFVEGFGCRVSGRLRPLGSPLAASVALRLARCRDGRFNRRYDGYLLVQAGAGVARLSLHAVLDARARPATQANLDAELTR